MSEMLDKLKRDIEIDEHALETECVNQPQLYADIGILFIEAKTDAKRLKEHLEYIKADLSSRIRLDPSKYNVVKITEASISVAIILADEYNHANKQYIDAQEIADYLSILLTSAADRKSMLKSLVDLYIYNYYSDTKMTKEITATDEVIEKKIAQRQQDKFDRKVENDIDER